MRQKKLYKTIERVASEQFNSSKDLLKEVLAQILADSSTNITGGRIWQLDPKKKAYKLLLQDGQIAKIDTNFLLKVKEYPILDQITKYRTVLAKETN